MATHKRSIIGNAIPDASGDVYAAPYSAVFGAPTAADLDPMCFFFNDSGTKDAIRGSFVVPDNYVGSAKIKIHWSSSTTSNNVQWDFHYLTRSDGEDLGAAATDNTDTVSASPPATGDELQIDEITLTEGDFAAGDEVFFALFRDSVTDAHADTVGLIDALFEYADA